VKPLAAKDSLPMLFREYEILEMRPIAKRAKKTPILETPEELAERAAKKAKKKKENPDAPEDPDDDADVDDEGENAQKQDGTDPDHDGSDGGDESMGRDEDRFAIAISSEFPVERWFGKEVLDHSPEAVDLSRARRGLSFLDSHDAKAVIGIVDKVKVGDDRKLRGEVRFSRSPQAQQIKTDIQDGIRRFISVGYAVSEFALDKSSKEEGDTYRATKWTPLEASSVGVPADPTVGNDRKEGDAKYPVFVRGAIPATEPNSTGGPVMPEVNEQLTQSRTAAAEIIRLGEHHKIAPAKIAEYVESGKTVEEFSRFILEQIRTAPIVQPPAEQQDRIDLTAKEQAKYNLARGIMAAVYNDEASKAGLSKRQNCFELEVSQEIEKDWKGERHGGLFVPWSISAPASRAGLSTNVATQGQELKFTEPGEFIQFLYNRMRVKELGARTISGLRDNVSFPKQTGKVSGSWVGENPGVDVTDANLTLGSVASAPHTYQSSTSYSRQLLAQAVIDVDTLVREDLGTDLALAVDSVAILGGGTNQPSGIGSTAGVQSYVMIADTANGGAPAWDDIVLMTKQLETANADQLGEGAWLTTPACKAKLKRIGKLANTIALPIWADDNTVDGYRARSTNQVSSTGTKGTGTNLSTLIRGIFETMLINMWGSGFELVVDPYRLKKQGMIELTTFMLVDVVLRYPTAFVVATDVITT
jgi:HK97 family phage major capsid protein